MVRDRFAFKTSLFFNGRKTRIGTETSDKISPDSFIFIYGQPQRPLMGQSVFTALQFEPIVGISIIQ